MSFSRSRLLLALELALVLLLVVRVWQFFVELPIATMYQQDYEEGNILNALVRISHGLTPYPDPHGLPNVINPYGPAAYYLLVLPVKLFGVAFIYPRVMVLVCTVAIAFLIGIALRRATDSVALAVAFGLIFLTIPNVHDWMWMLRVDLLGIAFTAAGLVVSTACLDDRRPERGRKSESKDLLFAGLLFAIAALVKPTLLAAPAAVFVSLFFRRKYKSAVILTGLTAGVFALVMGVFASLTRGAILTDVFLSHPDPFSWRAYTHGLREMALTSWPLVALAVIAIVLEFVRRRFSPLVLWVVFATLTATTAGKLGSNTNHFLEWNAALCLAAGIGFDRLTRLSSARLAVLTSAIAVGAAVLVISQQPWYVSNMGTVGECVSAYDWVRTQAGPNILAENVGALVLGDKKVWVSNPFVLAQLVEHAGWSDAALVDMVRERRFDAVSMRKDYPADPSVLSTGAERYSPDLLHAIGENYGERPGFNCRDMQVLYTPKPAIQSK